MDCCDRGVRQHGSDVRSMNQKNMEQWFQAEFVRLFNEDAEFHDQVLTCLLPKGHAETAAYARKCRRTWFIGPDLMETQNLDTMTEDIKSRRCREISSESALALQSSLARGDAKPMPDSIIVTAPPQQCNDVGTQVDKGSMQLRKNIPHKFAFGSVVDSSCAPGFVDGKMTIQVASRGFQSLWLLKGQLNPRTPDPECSVPDRPESPLFALVSCRGGLPTLEGKFSRPCVHCRGTQTWKVNPLYTSRSDTDSNDSWQHEGSNGTWINDSEKGRMFEDSKMRKIKRSVDSWPSRRINILEIADCREKGETQLPPEAPGQPTQVQSRDTRDHSNCCEKEMQQNCRQSKRLDTRSGTTCCTVAAETAGRLPHQSLSPTSTYFPIDLEGEDDVKRSMSKSPSQTPRIEIREFWNPSESPPIALPLADEATRVASNTISPAVSRSNWEIANSATGHKSATPRKSSPSENGQLCEHSGTTPENHACSKLRQDSETTGRIHSIGLLGYDLRKQSLSMEDRVSGLSTRIPHEDVHNSSFDLEGVRETPADVSNSSRCTGTNTEEKTPCMQETTTRFNEAERDSPSNSVSAMMSRCEVASDHIESLTFSRAVSSTSTGVSSARTSEQTSLLAVGRQNDQLVAKSELFPGHVPRWSSPRGFRPSPEIQWVPPRRNVLKRAMQSSSYPTTNSVLTESTHESHDAAHSLNVACDRLLQSCEGVLDWMY